MLWLVLVCLLMGSSMNVFAISDFSLTNESKVHGSTILSRWCDWLSWHQYGWARYGEENSFRGWNINGSDGRPTSWYYYNIVNPYDHTWFNGEDISSWLHFKYENIQEVTPDHPYVEIWVPTYDADKSNPDGTHAGALYVTDADGDDVLVGIMQHTQYQIDNFCYSRFDNNYSTWLLEDYTPSDLESYYNSGNYQNQQYRFPGILTNWGTFNGADGTYLVFNLSGHPEYVKLRYYPGYNMGETFDMSYIVNWDLNNENNNTSSDNSYNTTYPRYQALGKATMTGHGTSMRFDHIFTWSTDWPNMFVTKGIRINNKVPEPTVERVRGGKIKVVANNVPKYNDFKTFFVVENVGRLNLGNSASGNATMGSNLDLKQPLPWYSVVYRATSVKNGSGDLNRGTLPGSSDGWSFSLFKGNKNIEEPVVQEFKNHYAAIPGCLYPTDVHAEFDPWNQKTVITWQLPDDKDSRYKEGKFYVYRYEEGNTTPTVIGNTEHNGDLRVEDTHLDYSKSYTYKVSFIMNNWEASDGPEPSLTEAADVWTGRSEMFPIALTAESGETKITLNWTFPAPKISNGASFKVYRRNVNETEWTELTAIGTKTANTETSSLSAVDNSLESNCESYYYQVRSTLADTTFTATLEHPIGLSGDGTQITSLACNRGTYSNMIKVRWQVHQVGTTPTHYVLYRRLMSEGTDAYKNIYECDGTASSYYYEDVTAQPGQYYVYYVEGITECSTGTMMTTSSDSQDGFAQSKGVMSGRVSYGSGTAVEGVKVRLTTDSDAGKDQFYSLRVDGLGNRIDWIDDTEVPKVLAADKAFSVQFWMRPDNKPMENAIVMDLGGGQRLEYRADGKLYCLSNGETVASSAIILQRQRFYNVTFRYDGLDSVTVSVVDGDQVSSFGYHQPVYMAENRLTFGAPNGSSTAQQFYGNFDDIRLWNTCLSDADILANHRRILSGQEQGLAAYWPVDEGVNALKKVYDYSKQGGVANERHAQMTNGVTFSNIIPTDDQLSLYGETDPQGNYVIRGIPSSGDGTNYMVTPVKDSHEFSPLYLSRYVSMDALNHSAVDFTDVSSFEVKGKIRYAGTNIPVDSVQIYVDGRAAARNNEAVVTDENGDFIVDVPIGKHYISAVKDGHTFEKGGRIPVDPTGLNETTMEFVQPLDGLTFWDNTLVLVAGRVVGGAIEGSKPLGFGESNNNMGKAIITLEIPDTRYMLNAEEHFNGLVSEGFFPVADNKALTYPKDMIADLTGEGYYTGGGTQDAAQHVVITTSAKTGEFAVMLPPLKYTVKSVVMVNDDAKTAYPFNRLPGYVDASDPTTVLQDSIERVDGTFRYFDYVAALKLTKHTAPVLNVTQRDVPEDAFEGFFGDATANYVEADNSEVAVKLYDANGYTYQYPIFKEMTPYTFDLEGYEMYENFEKAADDEDRVTKVPLKDVVVTIANAMSATQTVYNAAPENGANEGQVVDLKENQLALNAEGKATYQWQAGLPNTQGDFTRTLNMTYNNGDGEYTWKWPHAVNEDIKGLQGIVFGDLPDGHNFTSKGPSEVEMILHDPYGDASFATWETGKVTVTSRDTLKTHVQDNSFMTNVHLGPDMVSNVGFLCSVQTELDFILDTSLGFNRTTQTDTLHQHSTTLEATRAISTSAEADFIGADGDIYIGKSNNLLFGTARSVGLKKTDEGIKIMVDNSFTVGKEFETNFSYSQYTIENVTIPNLRNLRNELLHYDADPEHAKNEGSETVYLTRLAETDEHYGEPGTYTAVKPANPDPKNWVDLDMVGYYNTEIENWQNVIAQNEEYKLSLFANEKAKDKKNLSFGGGSVITETATTSKTNALSISRKSNYTLNWLFDAGLTLNGLGFDLSTENHTTWESTNSNSTEETTTATFSYTLADSGSDDAFTIDVYKATGNHGPVFRTLGGQSSCPYEGGDVTKYYKPGKELSAATVQIERPQIDCYNPQLTGVPSGGKAQFELLLRNNSGTHTDANFILMPVADNTQVSSALLSLPTGPIGDGRSYFVPHDQTLKVMLTVEQGNLSEMKYDDIRLALVSSCQYDPASVHGVIGDTISLSAEFVPASTPVFLAIGNDQTVVNTTNMDDDVHLTVTGFDKNFTGLRSIDIQCKKPGSTAWTTLESYIPSNEVREYNTQELLPENGVIELALNMKSSSWTDGTYLFRALSSALYEGNPVTSESEVKTIIKDVKRPQLFGLANPSDGVLNAGDEITITFNEDIQKEMLTDNNFVVSGVLNGAEVQHDVALAAQNTERAAYTDADINLAKKDFSADMWVNVTEAGDIFTHGNGDEKFKLGIDDNNKLVVTIGSESYTSTKSIDKNTWTFLAFNYDYESGASMLNARAVTANGTKDLFTNAEVADYTGTGAIMLGQHFTGAIHELTLWDKARGVEEAQAEMYFTKKPTTPNLIGYWKMDEGDGLKATDYARSRDLTLAQNTWYLNNDNKTVTLSGTDGLKLNISECSALDTEDYAVEMWFKGDKADNTAASSLLYAGEESVGLGFNDSGALTMTAKGQDIELSKTNYLDNAWHHLALNVLRNGNATVYVDAQPVKTITASAVPALASDYLYVGSRGVSQCFNGKVDEIRFWKASLTGSIISSLRNQRLVGDEDGLVAYYPFETMARDAVSGIISSVSSAADLCSDTKVATTVSNAAISYDSNDAPALKPKPVATNVPFSYVANERSIVITVNEEPARLEGTTLTFNVRNVKDMNGNESNAVKWTAYIRQNSLLWKGETEVTLEKMVGESATFEATITNESGLSENWSLSGLPSWLTASATSGTLKAQLSKTITFTVAESTAPGKYEQTIYLTGNNNIAEPLTLYLKVKSEEPDWAVDNGNYEETMNVIGNLQVIGVTSQDEDDIIGAFIGNECRGVAKLEYKQRYDGYFVTMDIYGNTSENDKSQLEFKVFDASAGIIYPVVTTTYVDPESQQSVTGPIKFKSNEFYGSYKVPVEFNATDEIEQNIDLGKGWNWISLSVKPDDMSPDFIFAKAEGKATTVKSSSKKTEYDEEDEEYPWFGSLHALNNKEMYLVRSTEDFTLNVTGHRVNPQDEPITIIPKWNWLGYNGQQVINLNEALSSMNPKDGDVIKGQRGVAYYDEYEWIGSLHMLTPGKGYKLKSTATVNRTLTYPSSASTSAAGARATSFEDIDEASPYSKLFTPVDYRNYAENMVLIAQVVRNGLPVAGAELGIFAGDQCRESAVTDGKGMVIITVPGDAATQLTFRVADGSDVYYAGESVSYKTDDVIGTPRTPFVIELGNATGIGALPMDNGQWTMDHEAGAVYDLQGRKVKVGEKDNRLRKGVYIVNGKKQVK